MNNICINIDGVLKQIKQPSSKKEHILNVEIEVKRNFTENNNETLLQFLSLLNKNISLKGFKYLGYAKKLDKKISMTQMDEGEINNLKRKQKMIISSGLQNKDNKTPELSSSTKTTRQIKPKPIQQSEDDLANNIHETS